MASVKSNYAAHYGGIYTPRPYTGRPRRRSNNHHRRKHRRNPNLPEIPVSVMLMALLGIICMIVELVKMAP